MNNYFTIPEMSLSSTAKANRWDNTPTPQAKIALANLINNVLNPLREAWGKPIRVNSGYRSPVVNKAVGGAVDKYGNPKSQHCKGEAADITTGNKADNKKLFALAQSLDLPFDQLIDENGFAWVHISHKAGKNRKQILRLS